MLNMICAIPPLECFGKQETAFWEDFLSEDEINLLLAQPEWLLMNNAAVGNGDLGVVDANTRRSNVAWLANKPDVTHIYARIAGVVAEVNRQFFNFDLSGFYEPAQLTHYTQENQGFYDWHIDAGPSKTPRKLSMSLLLSNPSEFEGGEFQVKTHSDAAQTLECKRGRAWFFPSYTLHRVAPVTKGVRRSLVLWVGGPAFR